MAKVWEWSKAEGPCLLLALALADHADDDGFCFPGIQRLARKCRVSDRSIQRYIKELEALGELTIDIGKGAVTFGGNTNRYRLTLNNREQIRTPAEKGGDNLSPGDSGGEKVVTDGVKGGDKALSPEPSGEPSKETSEASIASKVIMPDGLDSESFRVAWDAWYAYRRQAKIKTYTAMGAWQQLLRLEKWGEVRAVAAINNSITQGFQGIYEEKTSDNRSTNKDRNAGTFNAGRTGKFAGVEKLAKRS